MAAAWAQRIRAAGQLYVHLANVLLARGQSFEARALAESVPATDSEWAPRAAAVLSAISRRDAARTTREWEMVDDFVAVLQLCQDVEDEADHAVAGWRVPARTPAGLERRLVVREGAHRVS